MKAGSLFSGIGGIDLGLEAAGFDVRWQVELDGAARSVLKRHFPDAHRHHDVREVGIEQLEPVDLVAGGFPCQDLSVAGRRAGLGGERSGLWWQFHRVLSELRPRWCLVENVPGLLSAVCPGSDGKPIPGGGCYGGCMRAHGGAMGLLLGSLAQLGYGFAYRVLDAQFFGLAQRRRRVLVVGCLGDGRRAAEVLLEPEGGGWNSSARGAERAKVAGTLGSQPKGSGFRADLDRTGAFIVNAAESCARADHARPTDVARCLDSTGGFSANQGGTVVAHALTAHPGGYRMDDTNDTLVLADAVTPLASRVKRTVGEGTLVADSLRASSGKSTSSNAHLVEAVAYDERQVTSPHNRSNPQPGAPCHALNGDRPLVVGTLTGESHASGDGMQHGYPIIAATLTSGGHPGSTAPGRRREDDENLVAYQCHGTNMGPLGALRAGNGNETGGVPFTEARVGVRRLTPLECERLQGFPDGWTEGQSDAARYRQLGNACPPQMAYWVAARVVALERRLAVAEPESASA